jgi:hypothetical protein
VLTYPDNDRKQRRAFFRYRLNNIIIVTVLVSPNLLFNTMFSDVSRGHPGRSLFAPFSRDDSLSCS